MVTTTTTAPPRSWGSGWSVAGLALVLAVVVWAGVPGAVRLPVAGVLGTSAPARGEGWPSPSTAGSSTRLGVPAAAPAGTGSFRFTMTQEDGATPVAYDPCRPIHVVVNGRTAPPGSGRLVEEALGVVSRATGLVMVVDGATTEAPSADRPSHQPDRYGDRWAPVLVAWSDPAEHPPLAGDVTGTGGSSAVRTSDVGWVYVSGSVVLDGPQLQDIGRRPGGYDQARGVIVHELAHVLGLDHVDAPDHLMHASAGATTSLHPGDLTGLAALGRGRCPGEL